jgi:hypothetical protein
MPRRRSALVFASTLVATAATAAPGAALGSATEGDERALERGADEAIKAGRWGRALALLGGLEALTAPSPAALFRMAEVSAFAGRYEQAIELYRRYAAAPQAEPERRARALAEAKRLGSAPAPFVEAPLGLDPATDEARRLFDAGTAAHKAGDDARATRLLEAALRLDPELPGTYRLLGALYGERGGREDRAREAQLLAGYLRLRPDGPIANAVRARLAAGGMLGRVSLDASFPCAVLLDGRPLGRETPLRDLPLPAGRYTFTLVNDRLHVAKNIKVDVPVGDGVARRFEFGVLRTRLEPWARVRVDGRDVGLWDEVGVPAGHHAVAFRSFDGAHDKVVELDIAPGGRAELQW